MAITTSEQTLVDGIRNAVMQFTGVSDGSGQETNVVKVDVSELDPMPDTVKVRKISYDVSDGIVELLWDADTPEVFAALSGENILDYDRVGGLANKADPSRTGNILLTTKGFGMNSAYTITLEMVKKYVG